MKENGFALKKTRSRRYPTQTISDADYANDKPLLANTPTQTEFLLDSFEQTTGVIGFQVNAGKTEYMCYIQKGDISAQNGGSLKSVDKLTYLESSVSSIENSINTWLTKA